MSIDAKIKVETPYAEVEDVLAPFPFRTALSAGAEPCNDAVAVSKRCSAYHSMPNRTMQDASLFVCLPEYPSTQVSGTYYIGSRTVAPETP